MRKPLPWAIGWPSVFDMTMETIAPFASREIAGISRWRPLFVLGTFCADIAATSNKTAAMYFMNEVPSHRGRRPAFSLIEFDQEIGDRSTIIRPAKHDFGYLQSTSLKRAAQNLCGGEPFSVVLCLCGCRSSRLPGGRGTHQSKPIARYL